MLSKEVRQLAKVSCAIAVMRESWTFYIPGLSVTVLHGNYVMGPSLLCFCWGSRTEKYPFIQIDKRSANRE